MKLIGTILSFVTICSILFGASTINAQQTEEEKSESRKVFLFPVSYQGQLPLGDMADRFGFSNAVSVGFLKKSYENWLWGFEGTYFFGNTINEGPDYLNNLLNSGNYFIGSNGKPADVLFYERGYTAMAKLGRLIPLSEKNANSGLLLLLGAGFMEHKISISDRENVVPQLQGEYAKGYDRLTNGFALSQYIGYLHLDKRKLLNFSVGIEVTEGFTKGRRSWNFDTNLPGTESRTDLLFALKISWMLAVYRGGTQQNYFYN